MSVFSVREHWPNRGGSFGAPLESECTRHFVVKTTSALDDMFTIGASGLLPAYLSAHPKNPIFTQRNLEFRQRSETPRVWDVVSQYSSKPLKEKERDQQENPLDRPAKIRTRSQRIQVATQRDRDGKPMVTKGAKEPFEPQMVTVSTWVVDVEKNVYPLPDWVFESDNKLNSDPVSLYGRDLAAETLQMGEMEIPDLQKETVDIAGVLVDVYFYPLKFSMAYMRNGWKTVLANAGYQCVRDDGTVGEIVVEDAHKQPVRPSSPQFLDAAGKLLPLPLNPDSVVWCEFDNYQTMDYGVLPLT